MEASRSQAHAAGRGYWIALGLLLLAALAIRLVFIRTTRLAGDEAMFYGEAEAIVSDGWFPVMCANVSGGAARLPGGTFSFLMALPLLAVNSPLAIMVWVVLINLLAYGLWIAVLRRWAGPVAALLFAGLLLFNPWSLFYSDRIWNPDVVILFSGAVLWAFSRCLDRPRSRHAFWVAFCSLVVVQFHISGVLLVLAAVCLWLVLRPRLSWKAVGAGAGAAAVLYVPYLVHEIQTGFRNSQALLSVPPDPSFSWAHFYRPALNMVLMPAGELGYLVDKGYWFPYSEWKFYAQAGGLARTHELLGGGLSGALLMGVSACAVLIVLAAWGLWAADWIRNRHEAWTWLKRDPLRPAFLLGLLLPTALMLAGRKGFHPHYSYLFYPLAFVPLVQLLARLARGRGLWVVGGWVALAAVAGSLSAACIYLAHERPISFPEQRRLMELVYEIAGDDPFSLEIRLGRSRFCGSSFDELARHYFKKPFQMRPRADLRFVWLESERGLRALGRPWRGRPITDHRVLDATVLLVIR
ncbi:MAG: hypothetical protein JXR96_05090 [Deltaproteobacteria bacterium]|nr:hypothetical protein [Deltaproteobacteria bacterium]